MESSSVLAIAIFIAAFLLHTPSVLGDISYVIPIVSLQRIADYLARC